MTTALVQIKKQWVILTLFTLTAITALSLLPLDKLPAFPGSDKTDKRWRNWWQAFLEQWDTKLKSHLKGLTGVLM